MRQQLEPIVGAAALDERAVRDLWPLALMEERAGKDGPRVTVARPRHRDDLRGVLRWAGPAGVTVVPMGGASGVCGAISPQEGELVLDMGAFDRILEIDLDNLRAVVQPGVVNPAWRLRTSLPLPLFRFPLRAALRSRRASR